MRVFITGAGMVGCYTAREPLKHKGEVTVFDLAPSKNYIRRMFQSDVHLVRGDISDLSGLLDVIRDGASRSERPRPDPYPRQQPFDLARARAELGYEPQYDLETGLRDFIQEIK